MGDFFNSLLYPIELLVAWIMYGFHQAFTWIGLDPASGAAWALSIIGLVLVMRAAMIPLFVKQINASRKMQMIQPELQKIQKKYKGKSDPESRQAMTQETMALYKSEGTNPFSSCLPILVQSPFFFGLFRVLNGLKGISEGTKDPIGPITRTVAKQAESATLFGAQLSDKFIGAETTTTKVVTILLIVLMSATTFTTQRQLMTKNMPASALDNPFAKQQKLIMYVMPVVFAVSGINFPIGVLLYWFTTNVWSMTQQFYVIRKMPAPGSAAERALHERLAKRGKPIPGEAERKAAEAAEAEAAAERSRQRVQPKGKKRAKKKASSGPVAEKKPQTDN
ncbi:putative inner membrane protein translocase component YidC [Janibacter sp. HTCC2649]|uniref:membrane protein insertase YidC n=1 Tax=Janibacter sp. HTCC2649 TaxID=313589 RepID=UPI0000671A74|nr:membrane protein insertase YidC [Janibacter sp. HTCC2649]EAP97968.1 putative inner membrane protein translocase component YidC [Janibacter sp. HTCC2649]